MAGVTRRGRRQLEAQRGEILERLDLSLDELLRRAAAQRLTTDEWDALGELEAIASFLAEDGY